MINAIYFKGSWIQHFSESYTKKKVLMVVIKLKFPPTLCIKNMMELIITKMKKHKLFLYLIFKMNSILK